MARPKQSTQGKIASKRQYRKGNTMIKTYNISQGLHFEVSDNHSTFWLEYLPDDSAIPLVESEIDELIEALKKIKSHFETARLEVIEREKFNRWIGVMEEV